MLRLKGSKMRRILFWLVFLVPSLVLSLWLFYLPNLCAVPMSFFDWKLTKLKSSPFVGLKYYARLWEDRANIIKTVGNNLFFTLWGLVLGISIALFFCGLITASRMKKTRMVKVYRSVMYFPNIAPTVAMAMVWGFMYGPLFGPVSPILRSLGFEEVAATGVLGNIHTVKPAILATTLMCSIGYNFVILLAAISTISTDYYEAAAIDGAGPVRQFLSITLPLIRETVITLILLGLASTFSQGFAHIKSMTNGGPSMSSEILSSYMFRMAFDQSNLGYGAAISTLMFILAIGIYLAANGTLNRGVEQ